MVAYMKQIILIALSWLALLATAQAASFDCSIASTDLERKICNDIQLNKADEEMSAYYFKLTKTLNSEDSKELLDKQRAWLKQRKKLCPDLNPMCLLSTYSRRINELKAKFEHLVSLPPKEATSFQGVRSTCSFPEVAFPEKYRIYGAGNYAGRKLNIQIDSHGSQATQFDIAVNSPDEPVALVLGAYDPAIWNISWTKGTKILAVAVTGYDRQIVIGTPPETPILISLYGPPCEGTYIIRGNIDALNRLSNKVFKRETDGLYLSVDGKSVVGAPIKAGEQLLTSNVTSLSDFIDKSSPPSGPSAIKKAITEGVLRPSHKEERQEWIRRWAEKWPTRNSTQKGNFASHPEISAASYVILKPFRIPAGLSGGNSAVFFLPDGVQFPEGDIGGAMLYDFNTMSCYGILCDFPCGTCGE